MAATTKQPAPPPGIPADLLGQTPGAPFVDPLRTSDVHPPTPTTPEQAVVDALAQDALDPDRQAAMIGLAWRDQQQASELRMSVDELRGMNPLVRALVTASLAPNSNTTAPHVAPTVDDIFSLVDTGDPMAVNPAGGIDAGSGKRILSQQQWEQMTAEMPDFNPATHIIMVRKARAYVDPDGESRMYHPGVGPVPKKEIGRKVLEGWLPYPVHPFLPPGHLPCQVRFMGVTCSYRGRDEDELNTHMTHWHPTEYAAMQRRMDRDAQKAQTATLTALVETIVPLVKNQLNQPEPAA